MTSKDRSQRAGLTSELSLKSRMLLSAFQRRISQRSFVFWSVMSCSFCWPSSDWNVASRIVRDVNTDLSAGLRDRRSEFKHAYMKPKNRLSASVRSLTQSIAGPWAVP